MFLSVGLAEAGSKACQLTGKNESFPLLSLSLLRAFPVLTRGPMGGGGWSVKADFNDRK